MGLLLYLNNTIYLSIIKYRKESKKIMKKVIILFLFSVGLISCGKQTPRDYRFAENGLIYKYNSNELYTGQVTDTADVIVQYDVVKGVKNGRFSTYYSNGNIEKTGWIEKNNNVGEWKYFYPDGKLECKGEFENDVPDGNWQYYYRDGMLKQSGRFKDGIQDGEWLYYKEDGTFMKCLFFKNGTVQNSYIYFV